MALTGLTIGGGFLDGIATGGGGTLFVKMSPASPEGWGWTGVVAEGRGEVTLWAGQRKLILKWADLVEYNGNRAQRGGNLPRGFTRVERIETSA